MGTAEVLAGMKDKIKGTVVFIFQPAEEGPPEGEEGGAELMVEEGVMDNPKIDAIFGIHINSQTEIGTIRYKKGATMAASDWFKIKIKGKQAHGSAPWAGVDPIVTATHDHQWFANDRFASIGSDKSTCCYHRRQNKCGSS